MGNILKVKQSEIKKLLTPDRLDLIIKYLYIESYINQKDYDYFLDLYKRHILLRTGGIEDSKKSISDFVDAFNELIHSFQKKGFDKEWPIPVSIENNTILNGAHRLACCLYFGVDAYIEYFSKKSLTWGMDWLRDNNFSQEDIYIILSKYIEIKSYNTSIAILWSPVKSQWENIQDKINKKFQVIAINNFKFDKYSFSSIVEDIYSYESGVYTSYSIKDKISFLMKHQLCFSVVVFNIENPTYVKVDNNVICKEILDLKSEIRDEMQSIIDVDKFSIIHTTDNPEHTIHISNILFNKVNLWYLKKRRNIEYRKEFLQWMIEYQKVLEKFNLSKEDCCIVGSSSLEVMGLRDSTDIDFILLSKIRENLFSDEYELLSENVDIVCKGYYRSINNKNWFSDDDIIQDKNKHFYFRGFKFATLDIIRERKEYQKRNKDLKDIMLIDDILCKNEKKLRPNFINIKYKVKMIVQIYLISFLKYRVIGKTKKYIGSKLSDEQKKKIKKLLKL